MVSLARSVTDGRAASRVTFAICSMTTQCAGAQGQLPTSLRHSVQLPLKRRRRRIRSLGRRRDRQLPLALPPFGVAYYSCSIQSHAIQFIHPPPLPRSPSLKLA